MADQSKMDDRLKHLFEYTKFHIGMYTTIIAGMIGVFANDSLNKSYSELIPFILVAIIFFIIAGAFGGLVASSIPYHMSWQDFKNEKLGPWSCEWVPAICCTHLEHAAFWLGCIVMTAGLFVVLL